MREVPNISVPEVPNKLPQGNNWVRQERHYCLITPLFGGGVEPGVVDPITPISGKAIRGHLRFWWRATRAGQFNGDLAAMKAAEDALWGSASGGGGGPSAVRVAVEMRDTPCDVKPFEVYEKKGQRHRQPRKSPQVPAYAAFPLQPTDAERKSNNTPPEKLERAVAANIAFALFITYPNNPKLVPDVEAALWAWETFGGIGARTRRGFGALQLESTDGTAVVPPCAATARDAIIASYNKHVSRGKPIRELPRLLEHLSVSTPYKSPAEVWAFLVDELKSFRQARIEKVQGLSHWPEANAIRLLARQDVRERSPAFIKFPRGQMGLPIIFHLPQGDKTLRGPVSERLASRLILRPLACQDGAVGLIVVLRGPSEQPGGFTIDGQDVEVTLSPQEAAQIPPLNGEGDVLKAFIDYVNRRNPEP